MVDEIIRLEEAGEEPSPCLQSYISPEYMAEGRLAVEMRTRIGQSSLPTWMRGGGLDDVYVLVAARWFNESDRQIPFLCWLFGADSGDLTGGPCERLVEEESPE
jgi:hypothetical protein